MVAAFTAIRDIIHDVGNDVVAIARATTRHTFTIDTGFAIGTADVTIAAVIDRTGSIIGDAIAEFITETFAIATGHAIITDIPATAAVAGIVRRLDADTVAIGIAFDIFASDTLAIIKHVSRFTARNDTCGAFAVHGFGVGRFTRCAVVAAITAVVNVIVCINTFESTSRFVRAACNGTIAVRAYTISATGAGLTTACICIQNTLATR